MKILVIEHLHIEPPALIGSVLTAHKIQLEYFDPEALSAPSPLGDYAGLVIMGGPMSANDDHLPYIVSELELIRQAIGMQLPMVGICLGAQLMVKAAGGTVAASPKREIGWYPVLPTAAADKDPLFSLLPATGQPLFQWHGETFTLPSTATLLATNPEVPAQAFRLGDGQYGLQFHVEVDRSIIEAWINAGDSERAFLGESGIEAVRSGCATYLEPMQTLCRMMIERWIPMLRA